MMVGINEDHFDHFPDIVGVVRFTYGSRIGPQTSFQTLIGSLTMIMEGREDHLDHFQDIVGVMQFTYRSGNCP